MSGSCIARELRASVRVLQERGLYRAAAWASELLVGLNPEAAVFDNNDPLLFPHRPPPAFDADGGAHDDLYLLAKSYFDSREYARSAGVLASLVEKGGKDFVTAANPPCPPREFFLRIYSLYLDGERRAESSSQECGPGTSPDGSSATSLELLLLLDEMNAAHQLDSFGLYMLGVLLKARSRKDEAIAALLRSVTLFPLNWSAWLDLASLLEDAGALSRLVLPPHWVSQFFTAHVLMEFQDIPSALKVYERLSGLFPGSAYLQAQVATALYNVREFESAQSIFERVRAAEPFRLEDADTFSNILYVQDNRSALSTLARDCMALDRYRPETCCVVGNYFSLRGEHEKAVLYFRRALRLNTRHSSAWTLMGHEYVELKNTPAAIECYRHAVEVNARDYRAWYGLGQTYELLQMYVYASYYYRRATVLRPFDARMWCALGSVYEQLERRDDAIASYLRAAGLDHRESNADLRLAKLYRSGGDTQTACTHYAAFVEDREEAGGGLGLDGSAAADLAEALLFLSRTALAEGHTVAAGVYASRVLPMPLAHEVEAARGLLATIQREAEAKSAAAAAAAEGVGNSYDHRGDDHDNAGNMSMSSSTFS